MSVNVTQNMTVSRLECDRLIYSFLSISDADQFIEDDPEPYFGYTTDPNLDSSSNLN
jgi:hypothetical protein